MTYEIQDCFSVETTILSRGFFSQHHIWSIVNRCAKIYITSVLGAGTNHFWTMFTKFTRQNIVKKKETTSVSAGQKMTLSNPLYSRSHVWNLWRSVENHELPKHVKTCGWTIWSFKELWDVLRKFVILPRRNGSFGKMLMLCFREKSRPFKVERGTIEIRKRKRGCLKKGLRS